MDNPCDVNLKDSNKIGGTHSIKYVQNVDTSLGYD